MTDLSKNIVTAKKMNWFTAEEQFNFVHHCKNSEMLLDIGFEADKLDSYCPLLLHTLQRLLDDVLDTNVLKNICSFKHNIESWHRVLEKYCFVTVCTDKGQGFNMANSMVAKVSTKDCRNVEKMLSQEILYTDDKEINLDVIREIADEAEYNKFITGENTILKRDNIYLIKCKISQTVLRHGRETSDKLVDYVLYIPWKYFENAVISTEVKQGKATTEVEKLFEE